MREIKFRMWTGTHMFYDISNVYECLQQQKAFDGRHKAGLQVGVIPYDHIGDGSVFLQFTGLKDKNGVDIYEGDIIHQLSPGGKDCNHVIEWSANTSGFVARLIGDDYGNIFTQGWIDEFGKEIIGNIYDNPELLK